ncbi:S1C family serine protease [Aliifodinibius salicampi]|uniref:S1C family serine protease n=1 Tax=Fodinibius salicampi TaxID=1920655 RepID=A0ABT3Q312_9BACT|nr:serine protease [Fodinibius salicampi]MCW9714491.1 S1C family serine protease [Fodinibius salicampi]
MKLFPKLFFGFLILIGIGACRSSEQTIDQPKAVEESEFYTTAFPSQNLSESLQRAEEAIIRIISTSFYDTYSFNKPSVTLPDVNTNRLEDIASHSHSTEESSAGTSILLDVNNRDKALLITTAHTVTSADTLITYYEGEQISANTFIETISIKRRQNNLIFTPEELGIFEIIARDALSDLALLSANLKADIQDNHQELSFSMGHSEKIQLGSFLYILGFPKGYPIITRGIASSTRGQSRQRFFVSDALFNPGISGGLVLASNDQFNSFEWVGMARSAAATREPYLIPNPDDEYSDNLIEPYNGSIFIEEKRRISYGITHAIPINEIRNFIDSNKDVIRRNNFNYP